MSKANRYDEEFKRMIVNLYQTGHSVKELIGEYGISNMSIYKWIDLYSPIKTSDGETTDNNEIRKLKKQFHYKAQFQLSIQIN